MTTVNLRYFAYVRERIGIAEETLALPDGVRTLTDLLDHLSRRGATYAAALGDRVALRAAINHDHAPFDTVLKNGDEVALFPPVTGG